jgi:hypothetical protein
MFGYVHRPAVQDPGSRHYTMQFDSYAEVPATSQDEIVKIRSAASDRLGRPARPATESLIAKASRQS